MAARPWPQGASWWPSLPPAASAEPQQQVRRCDDLYSPEGAQGQKIGVARDDEIGLAVDRQLQHLIVLRVPTSANCFANLNEPDLPDEGTEEALAFPGFDVLTELGTRQNVVEFGQELY